MFKPVTGAELSQFDAETVQMFAKRSSDERLTKHLLIQQRNVQRNNLPVVANPMLQWQKDREAYLQSFSLKLCLGMGACMFALVQFSKAYYPAGIIIRRSIPTTPMAQLAYRGPIGAVFLVMWYYQREYPRS